MLVRNYKKSTKYDPFYLTKKFQVADILEKGNVLLVKDPNSVVYFKRHHKDLERVNKNITFNEEKNKKRRIWKWVVKSSFWLYFSKCWIQWWNSEFFRRSQRIRKLNPIQRFSTKSIEIMYNEKTSGLSSLIAFCKARERQREGERKNKREREREREREKRS